MDDRVAMLVAQLNNARSAEEFYDAERAVATAYRTAGDDLVAVVVEHRATTASHVERARKRVHEQARAAGVRLESNGPRATRIRLLGGRTVSFRTLRLRPTKVESQDEPKRGVGQRGPSGAGVYPALEEIGIAGQSTPALRFEVAREVVGASSVAVARENLRERGINLDECAVLRLTYLVGELALAARLDRLPRIADPTCLEGEFCGKRVVACVDGGRVRMRVNPEGERNAKGFIDYAAPWREPKLLTIYVVDERGKRDRKVKTVIDGTMGDADAVVALLIGYLRLHGAQHAAHLTLAGDGAAWIWNRAEEIRAAVGLPKGQFAMVVDWYHATEKLSEVSKIPEWCNEKGEKDETDKVRKDWVAVTTHHLYDGDLDAVVMRLRGLVVDPKKDEISKHIPYFDTNRARMDYPRFRAAGIPMGSGCVESAVRRVVNLRMKGNSIFWLEEHAEAVLHLRSYLKAGRWDELVRAVLRRPAAPALREPAACAA
jgi:hypothetical protein